MVAKRSARLAAVGAFALAGSAGMACVDLFHSTDFATLCETDPTACASETGAVDDGGLPEATNTPPVPIELCAKTSTEARLRAAHACGWLGACLGSGDDWTFGQCMLRALAAYDCTFNPSLRPRGKNEVLWDCLARTDTCDAVAVCVFGTPAPNCTPRPGVYTGCNLVRDDDGAIDAGSVRVECSDSQEAVAMTPCALRGRTCARVDESKALCTGGYGAACTVTPRCDGAFAVQCRSAGGIDADEGVDCDLVGDGRCELDDEGPACAPISDAARCSGSAAVVCNDAGSAASSCVGGRTVTVDCRAIGQGCNADGVPPVDPLLACRELDAGGACAEGSDECSAGKLRSCLGGTPLELDCSTIPGLAACAARPGRRAACRPR